MAKKASRQDEHLFLTSILDNIPDMIFVKDAKSLRFVRFNKAGEKLLGLKQKNLIGKSDYDFFPKKEADFFTKKDRSVLKNKRLLNIPEEPIHTKRHGLRYLHTKKIPILNKRGEPQFLLGISEDITERKQAVELRKAEKALRDSEERYRMLWGALIEGVVVIDAQGQITSVNPGAEKILGVKAEKVIGLSISDPRWGVLSESGAPSRPEDFFTTRSLSTGESYANIIIGLRLHVDGRFIWINGSTKPIFRPGEPKPYAVVTSFFDITGRKEMQAEIERLNTELEGKVEQRTSDLKAAVGELEAFSYSVSHDLRAPLRAIEGFSNILLEDHAASLSEEGKRLLDVVSKNALHMSQLI